MEGRGTVVGGKEFRENLLWDEICLWDEKMKGGDISVVVGYFFRDFSGLFYFDLLFI